ncbi:MAG: GGDEF domain-containing protein [Myxococcota bacterium]
MQRYDPPEFPGGGDQDTQQIVTLADAPEVNSAAPERDRCTLTVLAGPVSDAVYMMTDEEMVLGRGTEASCRIDDSGLSRRHAKIRKVQDRFIIEDLGSTNGTWVGGRRLRGSQVLQDGDRIQMGRNTLLRFHLHDVVEQRAAMRVWESSVKDPLTRLYNRRHLDERLQSEFSYAKRHATPLAVLLLDVDHFKNVNDTFGHPAGDAVLRVVGKALERMLRAEDLVARYGGEEFCVLARGIDPRNAAIVADRCRRTVEQLSLPWESQEIRVTTSVGFAIWTITTPYSDVSSMLAAADEALYAAKSAGRNRAVAATFP